MAITITNPITRRRYTNKEKLYRAVTRLTLKCIKYVPESIQIGVLTQIRKSYKQTIDHTLATVAMPIGIELDLLTVSLAELVPIEQLEDCRRRVMGILGKYHSWTFSSHDHDQANKTFAQISERPAGGSWSSIGTIAFPQDAAAFRYARYVGLELSHFTSSIVVLHLIIHPSDDFKQELKRLIKQDMKDEITFTPTRKSLFRYWGSSTTMSPERKQQRIEDLINELKWQVLQAINPSRKTFLYFHSHRDIGPSVELYALNQTTDTLKTQNKTGRKFDFFWESVGMDRKDSFRYDLSNNGIWQLFGNDYDSPSNRIIKLTGNTQQKMRNGFTDINHQITNESHEFTRNLLPYLSLGSFSDHLHNQMARHRNVLYKLIGRRWKFYSKIVKLRLVMEREFQLLKRLQNEVNTLNLEIPVARMSHSLGVLTPAMKIHRKVSIPELIIRNAPNRLKRAVDSYMDVSKVVDDAIALLTMKSNYRMQYWTIILAFVTAILTAITVFLTYKTITH